MPGGGHIKKDRHHAGVHGHHYTEQQLYDAYKLFFGTLTSENRLRIVNLLRNGPCCVSDLQHQLKVEQTLLSHDLHRMRRCGFVAVEAKGKYRYYTLNKKTIRPLMELIDRHMKEHCLNIVRQRGHTPA